MPARPKRGKVRGQKLGKYNAQGEKVMLAGKEIWIPSAAQAERLRQLIKMEADGRIENLAAEVPVRLIVANKLICIYRIDAVYEVIGPHSRLVYEEVKGFVTQDWPLKRKLFDALQDEPLTIIQVADRSQWPRGDKEYTSARWMADNWKDRLPI